MKIYVVSSNRQMQKLKMELEKSYDVEEKENGKIRMTKNDFVLLSDEEGTLEGMEKLKNIIFLASHQEPSYVWKLVTQYKTIDIIDSRMEEEYIVSRVQRVIQQERGEV